jgi:type IV pilus assembly protein PilC
MFDSLDASLPLITVVVLAMSNFLKAHWLLIILVIVLIAVVIKAYSMTYNGQHLLAELQFRIPAVKNLIIKSAAANMSRTLSTLLSAGVPLVEAVDIVANTMNNVIIKEALLEAKDQIMVGVPLSQPIEECRIFPPMVHHMMKVGEEAGTTEEMLEKLADYYDEEVEAAVQALMAALEPMIIIILAVIVGILVGAVIAPMVSMYDALDNL